MTSQQTPTRHVLSDVPRVGFFPDVLDKGGKSWPEDIIFPSCMRSVMEFLGHPEYDYIHFLGVTGAGFFLNWREGWYEDNLAVFYMVPFDEHMKLFEYAFESTGYAMQFYPLKGDGSIDSDKARDIIVKSIDAGVPVLSFGVVGPADTNIIAGYDDGGDTLIGWSFFQSRPSEQNPADGFEPNGMYRKSGWESVCYDLFALGPRSEPVEPAIMYRRSLQWAVTVTMTPRTWGERHNGLAAFDAWVKQLAQDDQITADGSLLPGQNCQPYSVHDDAVGQLAESRYYVSKYLVRAADNQIKMRSRLLKAAGCYAAEHDIMWQVWDCVGGNGRSPEHIKRFADPDTRRKIIGLINKAKAEEVQAITHIQQALIDTE